MVAKMQAVILAGGLGTRLRPITYTRPKALVPLLNRPMVLHLMEALPPAVDEVILAASYMIEPLRSFFELNPPEVEVTIVEEEEPLGTGGALKNLEGMVKGTFLVLNGDVVSSISLGDLLAFHENKGGLGAIALWEVENPAGFGMVGLGKGGRVERFLEKPGAGEEFSKLVNAGVYVLEVRVLEEIPPGRPVSLEREVFPRLIEVGLYGRTYSGYWVDAGTLENYLVATRLLLDRDGTSLASGVQLQPGSGVLDPVCVGRSTILRGGFVGPYASLGQGCDLRGAKVANSVLLDGVRVGEGCIIEDSLVGSQVVIGPDARLQGCIVADGVTIEGGSKLLGERVGR